jgi:hypothetical protein
MSDTIELSVGNFTAMKIDRRGDEKHYIPMDPTAFAELLERGWQVVHKGKENERLRVVLRRPGKDLK